MIVGASICVVTSDRYLKALILSFDEYF